MASSSRSAAVLVALQHDDVAGGTAGNQRTDQLRGHRLVALRTLTPLQAVSERVCAGGRHEGARRSRSKWFPHGHVPSATLRTAPRGDTIGAIASRGAHTFCAPTRSPVWRRRI